MYKRTHYGLFFFVAISALIGSLIVGLVNANVVSSLTGLDVDLVQEIFYTDLIHYAWIAGFTEELLKNFGPLIVGYTAYITVSRTVPPVSQGKYAGAIAGFIFSMVESYSKLGEFGNKTIDSVIPFLDPDWAVGLWYPFFGHIILGTIAGALVARVFADREITWVEITVVSSAYVVLAFLHGFVWNTWVVSWL